MRPDQPLLKSVVIAQGGRAGGGAKEGCRLLGEWPAYVIRSDWRMAAVGAKGSFAIAIGVCRQWEVGVPATWGDPKISRIGILKI